jgi:hypothetical protein
MGSYISRLDHQESGSAACAKRALITDIWDPIYRNWIIKNQSRRCVPMCAGVAVCAVVAVYADVAVLIVFAGGRVGRNGVGDSKLLLGDRQ